MPSSPFFISTWYPSYLFASTVDPFWTVFTSGVNTKVVYVSSSTGDDGNDGLSPNTARKSLVSGYLLLRDQFPDWLLLKRGDVWTNQWLGGSNGQWNKRGSGVTLPMVISGYGTGRRPQVTPTGNQPGFQRTGGGGSPNSVDYVSLVGINFSPIRNTNSTSSAVYFLGSGLNFLVEGCVCSGFAGGITVQDGASGTRIRRNICIDSFASGAHAQGIYLSHIFSTVIEENILDHNGYHPDWPNNPAVTGTEPDVFNHNAYFATSCTDIVFKNNFSSRASSHGLQLRPGGVAQGNFFLRNSLSLLIGGGDPQAVTHTSGITGSGLYNVILEGKDIDPVNVRGQGIQFTNVGLSGGYCYSNIIAHILTSGSSQSSISLNSQGYGAGVGCNNVTVDSNIVYNWNNMLDINAPTPTGASPSIFNQCSGNVMSNNIFQEPFASGDPLVSIYSSGQGTWSNNKFHSIKATGQWFKVNSVDKTFAQWAALAADTTSTTGVYIFPNPGRRPGDYALIMGGSGSSDGLINLLRSMEYGQWTEGLKTVNMVNYFRSNFGLSN